MRLATRIGIAALAAGATLPGAVRAREASPPLPDEAAPALARPADPFARRAADPWFRAGHEAAARAEAAAAEPARARNAVLFLGDGMGLSTIAAARILEGQRRGEPGESNRLAFEALPHLALSVVYNTNQQVPDSAGTMTAMMSGVKTKAGVLGVDDAIVPGDHASTAAARVPTLLEEAEQRGLATGVVTTTTLTHATPAATYAHSPSRYWEDDSLLSDEARKADFPDLARQLVEMPFGDGIDVALGGGRAHFRGRNAPDPEEPERRGLRYDERDLAATWQAAAPGRAFVWNRAQLEALDPTTTRQVLGLFDPSHMEFELERASDVGGEPSLAEMTGTAIRLLARHPEGFVLVVEGGRIDHGHHLANAYRALDETIAFSDAVRRALELTDPEETLVVVTADHGHTLTLGGYATRGNPILGKVVDNGRTGEPAGLARDAAGLPYTTLAYANGPGHLAASDTQPAGPKRHPHLSPTFRSDGAVPGRSDLSDVDTTDPDYLQESAVARHTETHSGEDVPIYAGGPGSALFSGVREQSYVYHAIVRALGWDDAPAGSAEGPGSADAVAPADPEATPAD